MVKKYRNVQFCIKITQHTEIFMVNYIMKVLEKEALALKKHDPFMLIITDPAIAHE